jgi:hypothetical protein
MDCSHCLLTQKNNDTIIRCDGIDYVDPCPRNIVPKLTRDNMKFWLFFEKIHLSIISHNSYNCSVIKDIIDIYGIHRSQSPIFYDRCLIVINEVEEIRKRQREKQALKKH